MAGQYTIRDGRKLRVYWGKGTADVSLAIFARGPGYARTIVEDLPQSLALQAQESGFFLDFGTREALVYDTGVCWSVPLAQELGLPVGTVARLGSLDRLDLREEEADLAEIFRSSETREDFFGALRARTGPDTWAGWRLRWGTPAQYVEMGKPPPRTT
ncbi:MAG: hypothetical protein R3F60_25015 [bacterium]